MVLFSYLVFQTSMKKDWYDACEALGYLYHLSHVQLHASIMLLSDVFVIVSIHDFPPKRNSISFTGNVFFL